MNHPHECWVPLEYIVCEGHKHDHGSRRGGERKTGEALHEGAKEGCGEMPKGILAPVQSKDRGRKQYTHVDERKSSISRKKRARCLIWRTSRSRNAYSRV